MSRQRYVERRTDPPPAGDARELPPDRTPIAKKTGGRATSSTTRAAGRAAIVAIAPAVLLAGLVFHPYIGLGPPDDAAVAAAVVSDTTRWGLAHLTVGVGSGLVVLAFLAILGYLREAGEERWIGAAFAFIVIGSTLFAMLPGMEFAPLAAARTGGDVQGAQSALLPWFAPVLATGAFLFALGVLGFARGIAASGVLSGRLTRLVVGALVVTAAARFVPLGAVQFYVQLGRSCGIGDVECERHLDASVPASA